MRDLCIKKEYIKPIISSINLKYEDVILSSGGLDTKDTLDWNTGINGETWGK